MALRERAGKWSYRFSMDGKGYSGATGLDATKRNEGAAREIEAEHRKAIREGRRHRTRMLARRFCDAAQQYLAHCCAEHRDHPNTHRRIAGSFSSLTRYFGSAMVGSIGAPEIEGYKAARISENEVADITLRHDLHALSGFYGWCIRMGYAVDNPVKQVRIPSDKDAIRIHVLTAAEERDYFRAAAKDAAMYDVGAIILLQGMRPDEVLSLRGDHVDLERGTLLVVRGKTKAARRTLTLTTEVRSILARRSELAAKSGGWIFPPEARRRPRPGDEPMRHLSASGLAAKHNRALQESGTCFVPYDLRHTFATRMAQAGCDLATLAAILGHSSLRLVQRYVHPTAAHQAAAVQRFGAQQLDVAAAEGVQ